MDEPAELKLIVEAALLAAGRPMSLDALQGLFSEERLPERKRLRDALEQLQEDYAGRGIEVREVASGWRIQVRRDFAPWISRLWDEKPARYSRATMETLALIAYRQPITRGEIEDVRGVSVNTNTVKTLMEREWIRVVGHRDVPGKPALYATTRDFLDYFDLKGLDDLPSLAEIRDLDEINRELNLPEPGQPAPPVEVGAATAAEGLGEPALESQAEDADESIEASSTAVSHDSEERETPETGAPEHLVESEAVPVAPQEVPPSPAQAEASEDEDVSDRPPIADV